MAAPLHPNDRALDLAESWALAREVDDSKQTHARGAFRDLHLHSTLPPAESWEERRARLESFADNLVALETAQGEHDVVVQLGPHLVLSAIGPGVRAAERLLSVSEYQRLVDGRS